MSEFVQITRFPKHRDVDFYRMAERMYEGIWNNLLPQQVLSNGLSNRIETNVITPPDVPVPDCLTCGACCQGLICVGVRPADNVDPSLYWDVTTEAAEGEIVVDRYLRRDSETLACIALEGNIGERVNCTVYETRPKMCHHFDAGSDRCHAIRRAFGIEPFLTMSEMLEANEKLAAQSQGEDLSDTIRNAEIKEDEEKNRLTVTALMMDGTFREVHSYDPEEEVWMQFEFDGLRLSELDQKIRSKRVSPQKGLTRYL
ncbi:MAG: YkgJ family cysteine cluster protein [Acidobacteria bacterium]|nr:YkgJ family cysteine cluster protein [Acidobacteriota bacterium]